MSGLLDLLNSPMGKQLISGVAGQTGQPENKTADVLSMAMPLLLGAMKKNVASPQGAQGLMSALQGGKHDGSILDNLGGLFGGGVDDSVMNDGAGILGHVFGGREQNVANAVSKSSGLDAGSAMNILKVAAPFIMGYLGKEKRQKNVSNESGIGDLLGGLLGNESQQQQSMVERLLDADGDGSIIDDVAGMILGSGGKKKSGLGGLLGGLFGKK